MISEEQNIRLTRSGPGTPAGRLLRHYWQPAALTAEFDDARPLVETTVLGERRLLFRDETGRYALVDRRCPHRGADLAYARLEDGGLRCPFHGWLFDAEGRCLEQPAEPDGSRLCERVRLSAYPCVERNGIVFAWMGEGQPPELPALDCFAATPSHSFAFKGFMECNWLQALEVGIDPAHASFLHRYLSDGDPEQSYGRQFRDRVQGSEYPLTRLLREFPQPDIRVEKTAFGLRIVTLRNLNGESMHVRVTNSVFPQAIVIPMSREITITQWHVPVDDESSYWYAMFTSFGEPLDQAKMREQRLELYQLPGYVARRNRSNRYGYDPEEQRTRTYTGMGEDINVHDQWAVESQGAITDRTREHLGRTDIAIRVNRQNLLDAMAAVDKGEFSAAPAGAPPVAMDTVTELGGWESQWLERVSIQRRRCPWLGEERAADAVNA